MYLDHFGLREAPFRITPHTDFFFQGANRGATLEALLYAITHDEGIVKVSGEVGSGKTMLCRVLMERLPSTVETIYLANPSLSRDEILFAIGDELDLELEKGRMTRVLRSLQEHLIKLFGEGRRVVVLIDEAHAMPDESLEEIRLLSNLESNRHKLLQMVLFGQPELDEHLSTDGMRQLKERITHSFRLEPLVRSDIDSYIDFRMRAAGYRGPKVFNPGAVKLITAASQGLTRRVNILADKSLLAAFAHGAHAVTEKEVKKAARDSEFYRAKTGLQKLWVGAAALAAGLALGWGATALLSGNKPPNASGSVPQPAIATARLSPGAAAASATVSPGSSPNASAAAGALISPAAPTPAAPGGDATRATFSATPSAAGAQDPGPAAASGPAPPERGKLARERFEAAQRWLPAEAGDRYAIQLVTVTSEQLGLLEDFLLKASKILPMGEVYIYSVKINSQQHYRVAYSSYETQGQALEAIKNLPPSLAVYRPYTRSVERMRSQNRQ
jgi:type II secretory pathway predicted ATPase ExeA/septal ring-binding cell division protein DamX